MNLKSLKKLLALSLFVAAGQSWATTAPTTLPTHTNPTWNEVLSVSWSTDGVSWGNSVLTVGQSVLFQITLHKDIKGNHYADFVKLWLDKNGDGAFIDTEAILFGKHVVNASKTASNNPQGAAVDGGDYQFMTSSWLAITNAMVGDNWLLARATCSESLISAAGLSNTWDRQWYSTSTDTKYNTWFTPTREYYQGEAEFAKLTVRGNQVPEPASLALLGLGLVGVIQMRKARKS